MSSSIGTVLSQAGTAMGEPTVRLTKRRAVDLCRVATCLCLCS